MLRRLLLTTLALLALGTAAASTAFAHNSLDTSTPADGASVEQAPTEVVFVFAKDVPLDTLTVTHTDPAGVRTELVGSRHGATTNEVVTPLPALAAGEHSVRWRLVGADGHAVTGRVQFTVAAAATTLPAVGVSTTVAPAPVTEVDTDGGSADDTGGTPGWIRWLLRYAGYLALMVIAGALTAETFVWRRPMAPRYRALLGPALAVVAATAFLQLAVLAGDVTGEAAWSSLGELGTAAEIPAGMALVIRIVLAFVTWLLVARERPAADDLYAAVVVLLSLGMLGTWAFAGHARTMRWPWVGVPLDVAHHGAAAAWVGGLAVLGGLALPGRHLDDAVTVARRFSRVAAWSVGIIVATGVLQTLRLDSATLFSTTHGRLVVAKVVLLGVMLWMADRNRRLVLARFQPGVVAEGDVVVLRTMMLRELAVGLVVLGVTASLVVATPG